MTIAATTAPATNGATPQAVTPPAADVAVPVPAADAGDPKVSKAWAALAKKEKDLSLQSRKHSEQVRAERTALQSERKEYESWKAQRQQLKLNPAALLEAELGKDWYDKLTEYRLNGQKPTAELVSASVEEKFEALKKQQAEEKAAQQKSELERQDREGQEAMAKFRSDTIDFVKSKPDEYELIGLYGSHDLVPAVIEKHFNDTTERDDQGRFIKPGKVLSAKEAADMVEKHMEEQHTKAKAAKKFQAKTLPSDPVTSKRDDPQHRRTTLSNDMTASTPSALPPPKTDEERRERALAAYEKAKAQGAAATH